MALREPGRLTGDMDGHTVDYVVAGGGTAGAIVARRLAEDRDATVALLEAGPSDEGEDRILQLSRWMDLLDSEYDEKPAILPQPRGNADIIHSRGRMLGGCSSHNSSIAFRAPAGDFTDWEDAGASGWGPSDVVPYYDRVEQRVTIRVPDTNMPALEAVFDACEGLGLKRQRFDAEPLRDGCGRLALAVDENGIRQSSSVAYLHPLAELPANLLLHTNTRALRLRFRNDRVVGVDTDRGFFRAEREVVVSLGAFQTPALLQRSGIGPAEHLHALGVEVYRDLPGVGANLMDHPEGVVIAEAPRPLPDDAVQWWDGAVFATVLEHGADRPDLMMHVGLVPFDMHTATHGYPRAEHGLSLTPNVCRARSRGTVRLRDLDPPPQGAGDLAIDFAYFNEPGGYDEQIMLAGAKLAREIFARPELADWVAREVAPGPSVTSDKDLSHYIRSTANTVYHPMGTSKIGADDDPMAVVDPQLRVRGVDGLRIADASVFPTMVSVNPMITCMMVAERCADLVRHS